MIENSKIEFKREYIENIKYTVIAFANSEGGTIYVGIEDDGKVCGVNDVDETILRITNMVRDNIKPDLTLFVDCYVSKMEEKDVVVVNVQRGTARPYYLRNKGIRPEGVYIRQGASSVPASEFVILNLIKETSNDNYEDGVSLRQDLTFDYTTTYFAKKNVAFEEPQKKSLHIINKDGLYTNLGFLLSDQCSHSIKLAVFDGYEKYDVFRDRQEVSGSVLYQLEEAYEFIDKYNKVRAEFDRLERIDIWDYPKEAVREALLNAVVHRDYSYNDSTLISIFNNRLEIVTIGGLVSGAQFEDIMMGVSMLRNKKLANIFYRLKLIEAFGTGIMKIYKNYSDFDNKPLLQTSPNAFKITLPNLYESSKKENTNYKTEINLNNYEKAIIEYISNHQFITRKDVEEIIDVSQAYALTILKRMLEKNVIQKIGEGRSSKYILK